MADPRTIYDVTKQTIDLDMDDGSGDLHLQRKHFLNYCLMSPVSCAY